ncbi:uncharacterized protein TNCV_4533321 [Trichonephila clavipes]|nr:uncharacterized protein TNCV_4533321 [Trichonephila clavipes]
MSEVQTPGWGIREIVKTTAETTLVILPENMSFKRSSEMQYITTWSFSCEEKANAYGYCKPGPHKDTLWRSTFG